jgi:hypothetical protein
MTKRVLFALVVTVIAVGVAALGGGATTASAADVPKLDPAQFGQTLFTSLPELPYDPLVDPPGFFQVKPQEFDPAKTGLVQAAWLDGTGCPSPGAFIAIPNATFTGYSGTAPYSDPACAIGDPNDQHIEGLLLTKTGPSNNFASAGAELNRVKGVALTELGWDIRKPGVDSFDPRGSHCGAGAPRWNILTTTNFYFLGCNSPPPDVDTPGNGWQRMRWGGTVPLLAFCVTCTPPFALTTITGTVVRLQIVFDEGQDAGPDNFGAAILDNIDVNGALVGHGATDASSAP